MVIAAYIQKYAEKINRFSNVNYEFSKCTALRDNFARSSHDLNFKHRGDNMAAILLESRYKVRRFNYFEVEEGIRVC